MPRAVKIGTSAAIAPDTTIALVDDEAGSSCCCGGTEPCESCCKVPIYRDGVAPYCCYGPNAEIQNFTFSQYESKSCDWHEDTPNNTCETVRGCEGLFFECLRTFEQTGSGGFDSSCDGDDCCWTVAGTLTVDRTVDCRFGADYDQYETNAILHAPENQFYGVSPITPIGECTAGESEYERRTWHIDLFFGSCGSGQYLACGTENGLRCSLEWVDDGCHFGNQNVSYDATIVGSSTTLTCHYELAYSFTVNDPCDWHTCDLGCWDS